jgi:CRP-like cAMP-binding protein
MQAQQLQILQSMPIFGGIRDDTLEILLEDSVVISVPEGEFLFRENDPGESMYILEAGRVAILKLWKRIYYRLSFLSVGDCIGEMSLIDLGRRSASVLAMTDCRAIELTNDSLLKLHEVDLEQFALIQMNMGRELSRRLRVADEALFRELIQTNQIRPH